MVRIFTLVLLLLYSPWGQQLDNAAGKMHIYDVIRLIENIDKKHYEEAAEILVNNRDYYAQNAYMHITDAIKKHDEFHKYMAEYIDRGQLDNKLFPLAFDYYIDKGENAAVDFILRHSNDEIDYYKWCKIFSDSNILKRVAKKSYAHNELHFYANAFMYVKTGEKQYIDDVLRYSDERIIQFYYTDIVDEISAWNIINAMIGENRKRVFVNEITAKAVIDIKDDFNYALSGMEKELYNIMKQAINDKTPMHYEYNSDSVSMEILQSAAMLYTGNYEGYFQYREQTEIYAPVYDYLDMLGDLFTSDMQSFRERFIYVIVSKHDLSLKLRAYKLMLMSRYIDDGTFFRYYITGDSDAMRPILRIAGRDTPLMYEFADLFEKNNNISEIPNDSNAMLYRIIVDYENKHINRELVRAFIDKYPVHPAVPLLKDIK